MKTVFFTWITDDFRDTIIDFQGFSKSFKHFHPDIDLVVYDDAAIRKLFSEKPWLNQYNCKASFAKLLYNDYDLVVNVDSDFYFFDRCVEILEADYDVAACACFNIKNNSKLDARTVNGYSVPQVSYENYIQGGLIASPSKKFWDDYEDTCKQIAMNLSLYENDVLNVLWYSGKYQTKVLDGDVNFNSPNFKQYYQCAGLYREHLYQVQNDRIVLDDKPVRGYHVAHGNNGASGARKKRMNELFSKEVCDWFYGKIK